MVWLYHSPFPVEGGGGPFAAPSARGEGESQHPMGSADQLRLRKSTHFMFIFLSHIDMNREILSNIHQFYDGHLHKFIRFIMTFIT